MNAQVDFYLLETPGEQARLTYTCRLADKAQGAGHRVFVLTDSKKQSQQLDELMWTFSPSSFLPHARLNPTQPFQSQQPVLIHETPQTPHNDVLINLATRVPQNCLQFSRVLEILDGDEKTRLDGRQKFRDYKQKNLIINTHDLPNTS